MKTKELKNPFKIESGILGVQTVKVTNTGEVDTDVTVIEIKPSTIIERVKNAIWKSEYKEYVPENKLNSVLGVPCRNERLIRALK